MDESVNIILALIKSALTGKSAKISDNADWERIFKICRRQQIIPLVYYGIDNSKLDFALKQEFFNLTLQSAVIEHDQLTALKELSKAFSENGVDHLPLKGAVIKGKYPKTEMRTMSDMDILIKPEQYDKITTVMEQKGYTYVLESDHEFIWKKPPFVNIELHKHLIPSYNRDYYSYFGDGWRLAKPKKPGSNHYLFTEEDSFVYVFAHFAKHYRDGGIGLRHLTDIWVLLKNEQNMDADYIKSALTKLQLFEFYQNVVATLEVCFNNKPHSDVTKSIIDWIIEGGAYGIKSKYDIADAAKKVTGNGGAKEAKRKTALMALFPSVTALKNRYPVLGKAPYLLPIMWVIRIITAILFRRNNIKQNGEIIKGIEQTALDDYTAQLKKVGLKFN